MSDSLARFSVSLPAPLLRQLDAVVGERELPSRSHAVTEMIRRFVLDHTEHAGEHVMTGMITALCATDRGRLRSRLQDVQHKYRDEVISSHHVYLDQEQSMEALLVRGSADQLHALADEMAACRGVHTVKLAITAASAPLPPQIEGA